MFKLADLIEKEAAELATLESFSGWSSDRTIKTEIVLGSKSR